MATTAELFERYATPDELREALGHAEARAVDLQSEVNSRLDDLRKVEARIVEACVADPVLPFAADVAASRSETAAAVEDARAKVARAEKAKAQATVRLEDERTVAEGEIEGIRQRHAADPDRDAAIRYLDAVKTALPEARAKATAAAETLAARRAEAFRNPLVAFAARLGDERSDPGHFLVLPVRAAARVVARRPSIAAAVTRIRELEGASAKANAAVLGIVERRDAERSKLNDLSARKKSAIAAVQERVSSFESVVFDTGERLRHLNAALVRSMERQRAAERLEDKAGDAALSAVRTAMASGGRATLAGALLNVGRADLVHEWEATSSRLGATRKAHSGAADAARDLKAAVYEMDRRLRQAKSRRAPRQRHGFPGGGVSGDTFGTDMLTLAAVLAAAESPSNGPDCGPTGGGSSGSESHSYSSSSDSYSSSSSCDTSSI